MRLLIVEDNVPQMESLQLLLEAAGHVVYAATSVESGRSLAEVHPPDAVVLDLSIPREGGFSFLVWLRGRDPGRSVPVVVATGLVAERLPDLTTLGPLTVLTKPFTLSQLTAAIAAMTEGKQ